MTLPTRDFDLGDVLSVTTDRLVSPNGPDALYAVVDFVTGVPHWTHQLPRAMETVRPELVRQHTALAAVVSFQPVEGRKTTGADVAAYVEQVTAVTGLPARITVTAMPDGAYDPVEPIGELAQMMSAGDQARG